MRWAVRVTVVMILFVAALETITRPRFVNVGLPERPAHIPADLWLDGAASIVDPWQGTFQSVRLAYLKIYPGRAGWPGDEGLDTLDVKLELQDSVAFNPTASPPLAVAVHTTDGQGWPGVWSVPGAGCHVPGSALEALPAVPACHMVWEAKVPPGAALRLDLGPEGRAPQSFVVDRAHARLVPLAEARWP